MTDQERYKHRVKESFKKFLISPFIEYDPYPVNDERIIFDAKERSDVKYDGGRLQWMQSFASIFTIEGARPMEYNGKHFKQLLIKPLNGKTAGINFSDFYYHTSFYNGEYYWCDKIALVVSKNVCQPVTTFHPDNVPFYWGLASLPCTPVLQKV
ncbi:hypothetical protein [uncultured Muribaculum sp.]|uniref:hypothetical protein n=1 Tax=uncultured Muribaculum sp. TaxID=1918613 RepID=UPI002731F91C|nr:hypothetical protein [uncultured Muribaculum sp.]